MLMLRPRWRKVLADLWENKARSLLVVASIAVGIFAVGMVIGGNTLIPQAMNKSYTDSNPANITVRCDPFDDDLLAAVRGMDGVAVAEGQHTVVVRLRVGPDLWVPLNLVARSDLPATRVEHFFPLEGASEPADRQVLLVNKIADKYGLRPGAELEIELAGGARRRLPVAGVVRDLTATKWGFLEDGIGYITTGTLTWLRAPIAYDRLSVVVSGDADDMAHITEVYGRLRDRLQKSGRSLSLITNTLSALLHQHLRQIGVMKLVGARRPQVVGMYLVLLATFGVVALALAIWPSGWTAYALARLVADRVNFILPPTPVLPLIPQAVAAQAAMALIIPVLAGIVPVLGGSRITVQEAITAGGLDDDGGLPQRRKGAKDAPRVSISFASSRLCAPSADLRAGLAVHLRSRLSRPLLISIRNTFRRQGRLALTLFTLSLGGAVFIAVFNVRIALNANVEQSTRYFLADVNLDLARPYRVAQVEALLAGVPGVMRVEAWTGARGEVRCADGSTAGNVSIVAPPAGSTLVEPALLAGRWIVPGDENALVVNEAFWTRLPSLRPGDPLRIKIGGREQEWVVVGIFRFSGADELFAFSGYDYLSRLIHLPQQSAMYRIVTEDHSLAYQTQLSARLDELFRSQGYQVSKVEAGGSLSQTIGDVLWAVISVLLILTGLTALVGSIGLTGTLSMNVLERTREIGVMRTIGAHDGIVRRLVIAEGLLIGLLSFVLAGLLSFPITLLLSGIIMRAIFNTSAQTVFAGQGFAVWLAVVTVLATVASTIPARAACRLTIREVLAYE